MTHREPQAKVRRPARVLILALTVTLTMIAAVAAVAGIPQGTSAAKPPSAPTAAHFTHSTTTRHWQDD